MCLKPDRLEAIISLSLLCSEQKSLFPLGLLLGRIKKKKEREKKAKKKRKERKIAPSATMLPFPEGPCGCTG